MQSFWFFPYSVTQMNWSAPCDFVIQDAATAQSVLRAMNDGNEATFRKSLADAGCGMICVFDDGLERVFPTPPGDAAVVFLQFPGGCSNESVQRVLAQHGVQSCQLLTKTSHRWYVQAVKNLAGMLACHSTIRGLEAAVCSLQDQLVLSERQKLADQYTGQIIGDSMARDLLEQRESNLVAEQNLSAALFEFGKIQHQYTELTRARFNEFSLTN